MQGGGDRYAKGISSESRGTKQVQSLGVQGVLGDQRAAGQNGLGDRRVQGRVSRES